MAVFLGLQSFSDQVSDKHVKTLVDNTTAMTCINQMGTCHSNDINSLVIKISQWCIRHNIWLRVAHISGKDNIIADGESRKSHRETEWALNPQIYQDAIALTNQIPGLLQLMPFTSHGTALIFMLSHHSVLSKRCYRKFVRIVQQV